MIRFHIASVKVQQNSDKSSLTIANIFFYIKNQFVEKKKLYSLPFFFFIVLPFFLARLIYILALSYIIYWNELLLLLLGPVSHYLTSVNERKDNALWKKKYEFRWRFERAKKKKKIKAKQIVRMKNKTMPAYMNENCIIFAQYIFSSHTKIFFLTMAPKRKLTRMTGIHCERSAMCYLSSFDLNPIEQPTLLIYTKIERERERENLFNEWRLFYLTFFFFRRTQGCFVWLLIHTKNYQFTRRK